jgi:hypothetical protein
MLWYHKYAQSLKLASTEGAVKEVDRLLEEWNYENHNINEVDSVRVIMF